MYAVIKTGGKQYRVKAGDLLVVEKLDGEPGARLAFDEVLMIGEGAAVTVGKPTVAGASVSATLVETRKGEKIKVFKKIRRQGYRRTRGHRQYQSVLRVTGIAGDGKSETWDGTVDLTPLAVLNARARNLARGMEAAEARRSADAAPKTAKPSALAKPAGKKAAAKSKPSGAKAAKSKASESKAPGAPAPAKIASRPETAPAAAKKAAKKASAQTKAPTAAKPARAAAKPKAAPAKPAARKPSAETKTAKAAPAPTAAKKATAKKPAGKTAKPTGKKG